MPHIRHPHRFPLPAALGIALALAAPPIALASPVPGAAPATPNVPAWSIPSGSDWLPLGWLASGPLSGGPLAVSSLAPGLWVTVDPVTRRPVAPTPEQRRAMRAALAPSAPEIDTPLRVERLPGGGELIHLDGRFMIYSIARRDASGRFVRSCAADSVSAARIVAQPAPAPHGREER